MIDITQLKYGVIYILAPFSDKESALERQVNSLLQNFTKFKIEKLDVLQHDGISLISRRFNVGNVGKCAIVHLDISYSCDLAADINKFIKAVTDVVSEDRGNLILEPTLTQVCCEEGSSISLEFDHVDIASDAAVESKKTNVLNWVSDRSYKKRRSADISSFSQEPSTINYYVDDEEEELRDIERQKQKDIKAIEAMILEFVQKYHDDPSQIMNTLFKGKIVFGDKQPLSPLLINGDLKIVLPNYNEVEVKMPAMCRTIYIFFLLHPEGIALRDIADHRTQLEEIYDLVMPGRDDVIKKNSIDNLLNPLNNTLNEYISKIKRCFKVVILNDKLAHNYRISGKRGGIYRIPLESNLVFLPKILTVEN